MALRASSLPLLMKCAGSLVLPHSESRTPEQIEKTEEAADWGTMVHHWKETGEVRHENKRTATAFRKAIELSGADRHKLWPGGRHEVAISLAVDGTRRVESGDHRAGQAGWLTCHIDWDDAEPGGDSGGCGGDSGAGAVDSGLDRVAPRVSRGMDGTPELHVNDLKTGKRYAADLDTGIHPFLPDPESAQLRTYGLADAALARRHGELVEGVWLSITHWPRLPLAARHSYPAGLGPVWYTWESLEQHWTELERLHADYTAGTTELRPGDHCRFCPSKLDCIVAQPDPPPFDWRNHRRD